MCPQLGKDTTKEEIIIAAAKLVKEDIRSASMAFNSSEAFPDVKNLDLSEMMEGEPVN